MIATIIYVGGPKDGEIEKYPADRLMPEIIVKSVHFDGHRGQSYQDHLYSRFDHLASYGFNGETIVRVYFHRGLKRETMVAEIDAVTAAHDADIFERSQRTTRGSYNDLGCHSAPTV